MTRALVVPLLVILVAGCASPSEPAPLAAADAVAPSSFLLDASGCDEGGGYVTWNTREGEFPPMFATADVSEDLGHPPVTSMGESPGNVSGAYHATIRCATWTLDGAEKTDLVMAFVGGRIHPPPFDPAPVARQYAGNLGVTDPDLLRALETAGLAPEPLTAADLSFAGGLMLSTMEFSHHGDIISVVPVEEAGVKADEVIRIWVLVPTDDGGQRPVSLDLVDAGGTRLVASGPGWFDHRETSTAPPLPGAPIHEFPSWALAYRDFERAIRPGPAVDVVFDGEGHAHETPLITAWAA